MDPNVEYKYYKYLEKNKEISKLNKVDDINIVQQRYEKLCQKILVYDMNNIRDATFEKNKLYINDNVFLKDKDISRGSFGDVQSYKNINDEFVAIKFSNSDENLNDEIKILNYLKSHNICNNIYIKTHIIHSKIRNIIIMEHMDGTLEKCINMLPHQKINIFNQVVKYIYCLEKSNLYYIDIKLNNILYRCNNNNTDINIILGDIGSIINTNNLKLGDSFEIGATYPPPEHNTGMIEQKRNNYLHWRHLFGRSIVWSLGILFLMLFGVNGLKYLHDTEKTPPKNMLKNMLAEIPNDILSIYNSLIKVNDDPLYLHNIKYLLRCITKILSVNPNNRMDVEEFYFRLLGLSFDDNFTRYETYIYTSYCKNLLNIMGDTDDVYIFIKNFYLKFCDENDEAQYKDDRLIYNTDKNYRNLSQNQKKNLNKFICQFYTHPSIERSFEIINKASEEYINDLGDKYIYKYPVEILFTKYDDAIMYNNIDNDDISVHFIFDSTSKNYTNAKFRLQINDDYVDFEYIYITKFVLPFIQDKVVVGYVNKDPYIFVIKNIETMRSHIKIFNYCDAQTNISMHQFI